MNCFFLGYIWKLPGSEQLWFLTVLMACYAEYIVLSKLRINNNWFPWIFLIGMTLIMVVAETICVPGNAFAILGFFAFVLLKVDWFIKKAMTINLWTASLIIVLNIICAWLLINGLFEQSRILAFLFSDICGCLLLAIMIKVLPKKENRITTWLSGISFEIYIVHHTLCVGPFVRITSWGYNHLLQFVLVVVISLVLALLLHLISNHIFRKLEMVLYRLRVI